ncbi:MAG: hypothetical protein QGH15_17575 [Kiritimatiellia bacterium]|jgi:hypothetical protein|nr:hypothetical protein [Kiritimatiellia bacterium]
MGSGCICSGEYIAEEVKALGRAVEKNREKLSRTSGREVGYSVAKRDFTDKHLQEFARGFHQLFCGEMCPERRKCQVDWYAYCTVGRESF